MTRPAPHPALRVPLPGGGAESGDWTSVRWSADGIPLLVSDVDGYLEAVGADLDAPLTDLGYHALAHLARYVPQLLAPRAPLRRAIRDALARHVRAPVELGCSVGPDLRTLAAVARAVIGVDSSIAALRAARTQLAGEPLPVLTRIEGRSFRSAEPIVLPPIEGVVLAVGNALDPPLFPGVADIVMAVNLLDSVASPLVLVAQMDAVLKPGGLMLIASPFSWSEDITPPEEALGGGTDEAWAAHGTAVGLVQLLTGQLPALAHLDYEILEASDVPWSLREHARSMTHYDVHLVVARKRLGDVN